MNSVVCLTLILLNSSIGFLGLFIGAIARLLHPSCSNTTVVKYYLLDFSINLLGPYSSETLLCNEGILGIASIKTNFIQIPREQ